MTRTMGDLEKTRLRASECAFFRPLRKKDPIYLAWRLDDRVQLLTAPDHFRWPVLI